MGVLRKKREDAAAEFFREEAVRSGVKSARHNPELPGAARRGIDHFGMAAGKRFIHLVTDEQDGERARGGSFHRRNFRERKTSEFFSTIQQRPTEGGEKSSSKPGIFSQTGVIVRRFGHIGERGFGDDSFDARCGG